MSVQESRFARRVEPTGPTERGEFSIGRIINVLKHYFTGCFESDGFEIAEERLDNQGMDILAFPTRGFSEAIAGLPVIQIEGKSSELGVEKYMQQTVNINGVQGGSAWRRKGRVVLNGSWTDQSLAGDIVAQVMNLAGVWGKPDEMAQFLDQLPPEAQDAFRHTMAQGVIDRERKNILDWVRGKNYVPKIDLPEEWKPQSKFRSERSRSRFR